MGSYHIYGLEHPLNKIKFTLLKTCVGCIIRINDRTSINIFLC